MIILRLSYAANLPDPTDILKKITEGKINVGTIPPPTTGHDHGGDRPQLKAIAGGGGVVAEAIAQPQSYKVQNLWSPLLKCS